ncbi:MAG: hypothetical protein ACOY93_08615 [Bacillota bacterium]
MPVQRDPLMALLEELAEARGYRLVPKEPDGRAEPTELDRFAATLKATSTDRILAVIGKLKAHRDHLQGWGRDIEAAYRRRAYEIPNVDLPGTSRSDWKAPRLPGLVEALEFADAAIRLAEEVLADRILREAAAEVMRVPLSDDPSSCLVIESLVALVTESPRQETPDAAA